MSASKCEHGFSGKGVTLPEGGALVAEQNDWLMCHECGSLQHSIAVDKNSAQVCANCENSLRVNRADWVEKATALSVAALFLFIACNAFTFLTVHIAGQSHSATLFSGVIALFEHKQWILAGLVLTTIFLYPILEIFALLYVLLPFTFRRHLPGQVTVFKYLVRAQPWSMLDIFFLGALVTVIKIRDTAEVYIGAGGYLFFALVVVVQMAYWLIDKKNVWNWLNHNNCFTYGHANDDGSNLELYDCSVCAAVVCEKVIETAKVCPRCETPLHKRKPKSLERTFALLIASVILYIPANLLPIMDYEEFNIPYSKTIVAGVIQLAEQGLWVVAGIVFIASVVVPIAKLAMLFYLVWSVKSRHKYGKKARARLYRITEIVGRWSMVDVFVVTLLTAVVQFGFIGIVEPGLALLPFAAVVVLTMLAADAFDPRLIWDGASKSRSSDP